MSSTIKFTCACLNIKLHLASKYNLNNIAQFQTENSVLKPESGWEVELAPEGVHAEYEFFVRTRQIDSTWKMVECLNCSLGPVYSITNDRVIIHRAARRLKDGDEKPSSVFHLRLHPNGNSAPIPNSMDDVPDNLVSAYKQVQSVMDSSIKRLRIESNARIEDFKREEEKRLEEAISRAKIEINDMWRSLQSISIESKTMSGDTQQIENDTIDSQRRLSFDLDESLISNLRNINLENQDPKQSENQGEIDLSDEEEEDMFNLDEELLVDEGVPITDEDSKNIEAVTHKDGNTLLSASLMKSISEIDQRFSWIKKKKKTSKYLLNDFDIKSNLPKDISDDSDQPVSLYATSMPITIQYLVPEEENEEENEEDQETEINNKDSPQANSPKKRVVLTSSFANYDFSFSDRLLSEQFPTSQTKKGLLSSSAIGPQLDSLMSESLDTRNTSKKEEVVVEKSDDDEDFDANIPPHIWAAKKSANSLSYYN